MLKRERSKKRPLIKMGRRSAQQKLSFAKSLEMRGGSETEIAEPRVQITALKRLAEIVSLGLAVKFCAAFASRHAEGGSWRANLRRVDRRRNLKLLQTAVVG